MIGGYAIKNYNFFSIILLYTLELILYDVIYMLSKMPILIEKVKSEDIDKEILRIGMIAELDAMSLYEQLASMTENNDIKKVLLDIAKEEKTHLGEFLALLLKIDGEQKDELEKGKEEVEEITGI